MLEDFTSKKALQCKNPNGCSLTTNLCKKMKNCNEHGTCKNGKCVCNKGFTGADCSVEAVFISSQEVNLGRNEWSHFYTYESVPFVIEFGKDYQLNSSEILVL